MQNEYKGIRSLYEETCVQFDECNAFYEWNDSKTLVSGMICKAPAWYEKDKRWFLSVTKVVFRKKGGRNEKGEKGKYHSTPRCARSLT